MGLLLVLLLFVLVLAALPRWPYSANWGYTPGGLVMLILLLVLVLVLLGEIPPWGFGPRAVVVP